MCKITAQIREAETLVRGISNDKFQFVHTDFKVLADFLRANTQQAVITWAFHSFLITGQALCEEHKHK